MIWIPTGGECVGGKSGSTCNYTKRVLMRTPCITDCNDLEQVPLAEFNARFERKEIRCFDKDLPAALRRTLRKAIHGSTILPAELKALVAKP